MVWMRSLVFQVELTEAHGLVVQRNDESAMNQGLLLIEELLVLAVEVQRLFEIALHEVANSYLVNCNFGALEVIEQLRAEIQPFQEFDGSVEFASVFLNKGHAKGHVGFSLDISYFYARSRFHLHILKLAHLILSHTF